MDWVRAAAAQTPHAPALVTGEGVISYRDLDRAADGVAAIVTGSGLEGGVVALWGLRHPATVAALWGIARAGAAAVPIDPSLPPAESMRLTRMVGATGLWDLPEGGFDALLDRGARFEPRGGLPESARLVVFTSGSEGGRKGVRLDGTTVSAAVSASQERLGNGPGDGWLAVLPLFHIGGLSILWRQAAAGAPVVLHPGFDAARVAADLGTVAFASLVPTMVRRAIAAGASGHDGLRGVLIGGGPADPGLLTVALDAGIPALQTYGMTETCSQVCTVAPGDARRDLGTAGRPLPGADVAVDGSGRIRVRGPMVSPGYVGEPDRHEAWFTTGDLGRLDGEGRLTVLGRADRVIVTGGENVHPAAVERALRSIPGVSDARVFGEPDPEWGSRVVAEIVLAGTTVAEVAVAVRTRVTAAEVPRRWSVVESLPGKLD